MLSIHIQLTQNQKNKPPEDQLGFGLHYTDHMFIMDYTEGVGWHHPRIVPYQPILIDPAAKVFHYGQSSFEGLKAYKAEDGRILLFRPKNHIERLNRSNERLSIPPIDERLALDALIQLVRIDRDWIPSKPGTSLYIRPFIIATEPALGVAPSTHYQFIIILSPVGAYYSEGTKPVKIHVESEHVRAVKGGMGEAKTAGNYAAGLQAQQNAKAMGYTQVLWLDGVHRTYIEEVGSMNLFLVVNGTVLTPALTGSILNGITRNSVIQLLQDWDIPVLVKQITIEEVYEAGRKGQLEEAFGTGTAVVLSPISEFHWRGSKLFLQQGELSHRLYRTLTGIQAGTIPDKFGWTLEVEAD